MRKLDIVFIILGSFNGAFELLPGMMPRHTRKCIPASTISLLISRPVNRIFGPSGHPPAQQPVAWDGALVAEAYRATQSGRHGG